MSDQPTALDLANAATRRAIAGRQASQYQEAVLLALAALGGDFVPWMKLSLIDADRRRTGDTSPAAVVYKVYRGAKTTENSKFIRRMADGRILKGDDYQELFGDLLHEKHPTKSMEIRGAQVPVGRYELVWSAIELYYPRDAESLAAARIVRERNKAEREEKRWAEAYPLLSLIERVEREGGEKGR